MEIETATTRTGRVIYNFTANRTDYSVTQEKNGDYCVLSTRKGFRFPTCNRHTKEEMRNRSKALRALVDFIEMDAVAA